MAGEPKDGISIPYSGLAVVALVATTLVVQQAKLDSARPPTVEPQAAGKELWLQDVEARLWHDPFAVIEKFRKTQRAEKQQELDLAARLGQARTALTDTEVPPDDAHGIELRLGSPIRQYLANRDTVRLLGAMVFGSSTEEDAEMRRRTRYATVSALVSAGYTPENADNLGYVRLLQQDGYDQRGPLNIPFEWFTRDGKKGETDRLLLLWLDQSYYYNAPLPRLRHLKKALSGDASARMTFHVLGPADSDAFGEVVKALQKDASPDDDAGSLEIVSTSATSPLTGNPTQPFLQKDTTLYRLTGTDDRLVHTLLEDLKLRRPFGQLNVAFLREIDTGYGRMFATTSGRVPPDDTPGGQVLTPPTGDVSVVPDPRITPRYIGYLRQLDGGQQSAATRKERNAPAERTSDSAVSERAHGPQQYDYLRRLAGTIRGQFSDRRVDAIGVFGNDVYDKLLILRALRSEFPNTVFMTTDADARLLDPQEATWTQNLVVASNFDLALHPDLQRGPPFRDAYQTAAYFGALLIAGNCIEQTAALARVDHPGPADPGKIAKLIGPPRLYEVGRSGFTPLVHTPGVPLQRGKCNLGTLVDRGDIPQLQPALHLGVPGRSRYVILIALALGLAWAYALVHQPAPALRTLYSLPRRAGRGLRAHPLAAAFAAGGALLAFIGTIAIGKAGNGLFAGFGIMLGFLCGLAHCFAFRHSIAVDAPSRWAFAVIGAAVGLLLAALYAALWPVHEPFAWAEGTSVWPTQLIRFLAAGFGLFSLAYVHRMERRNARQIGIRHRLRALANTQGIVGRWNAYLAGRRWRSLQTLFAALAYLLIGSGLMGLLGATPGVPARGAFNIMAVQVLIGFAVIIGIVLVMGLMWAYRAAVLQLCRPLMTGPIHMPTAQDFGASLQLPAIAWSGGRSFVDLYLAHGLVAERLTVLTRMVYFPFAVCALLIVARSRLFDGWDTPIGLGILLLLPFALLFGAVVLLRNNTIAFHDCLMQDMQNELLRIRPAIGDQPMWQLEKLLAQVDREKRGSFQSLAVQPFIRALLLPVGGFSGIELLEHLVLR